MMSKNNDKKIANDNNVGLTFVIIFMKTTTMLKIKAVLMITQKNDSDYIRNDINNTYIDDIMMKLGIIEML